jgi:catechol 2,3-dioxygenase-like lactoylglutathione lyase family enzyme
LNVSASIHIPARILVLAVAAVVAAHASGSPPARPRITGISHVALWVGNLDRSRAFYEDYLGFGEPYALRKEDGSVLIAWIKINDRQSLELFPTNGAPPARGDSLYHVALETDDAQGMLDYLVSHGVRGPGSKPLPARAAAGRIGNLNYFTEDPDGHVIEFVQYMPGGWTLENKGRFLPGSRIAGRMSHAGFAVANLEASLRYYRDILGFRETWRGSRDGKVLSWVNLRVPDGEDYIELMLYAKAPDVRELHVLNHFCLEVSDAAAAGATLAARPLPQSSTAPTPAKIGVNRKRQINCFDPDGTRAEVMEASTVDGKPAPSSPAPPPDSGESSK